MSGHLLAVADTSVLYAAFDRRDPDHPAANSAMAAARILLISPMVLAELDYLLTTKVSERIAIEATKRINALSRLGIVRVPVITTDLQRQAEELMVRYEGHAIGLTDMTNAALCWQLPTPVILSLDRHYRDVIAPRKPGEKPLEVLPAR
ncbi:type II toxin-antitoxin system VapC family toxin [Kitasatospora sp. NPDC051853]|uniref:type II toxin-antitoxin system VapC family toxin n=1 Tax=Kitasatospora sp. NPDC051853 TaxID=3364058 RepID=UPI0037B89836